MCCNSGRVQPNAEHREEQTAEIIERFGRPWLAGGDLAVEATPMGPGPDEMARVTEALREGWLRQALNGAETRLISFRLLEDDAKTETRDSCPRFMAQVYDYTNQRTLQLCARLDQPERASVRELAVQPLPSEEEFEAALEILANQSELGAALRRREIIAYRPMPPLVNLETPEGRIERTLTIGLVDARGDKKRHQLLAVNMTRGEVLRDFVGRARDSSDECGPPPATNCPATGNSGQVAVTVTQAGKTLWQFDTIRPAASSGTNGSGIELRGVRYRGKQLLYRAHVPILNIEYFNDGIGAGCGPTYRDWQNQETCFEANGSDVIPGFRLCNAPARTIIESNTDGGNFRGVAIYVEGQEVVLVSEMSAGWYRYISAWRFHADGTLRPRFGFAAANNPCTCREHHHHVYWRMDFDIRTASDNVVEEYNSPPLVGNSPWHTKRYEIRRARDASRNRHWRVRNRSTGEGYSLVPGASDGGQDAYGVGDFWVLRYRGAAEHDDGQGFTTDPALSRAHIDRFVNGEVVEGQDVVLWYAAHFRHTPGHSGHYLGPDLRPHNW